MDRTTFFCFLAIALDGIGIPFIELQENVVKGRKTNQLTLSKSNFGRHNMVVSPAASGKSHILHALYLFIKKNGIRIRKSPVLAALQFSYWQTSATAIVFYNWCTYK